MSGSVIIFCPYKKADVVSKALKVFWMTPRTLKPALQILHSGGTILVDDRYIMGMGWAAPDGTEAVYIEGFPETGSKIRTQAEGRYNRLYGSCDEFKQPTGE